MYLSNIIEPLVTKALKEQCIGKKVTFRPTYTEQTITILCKDVQFCSDDGDCWIKYIDQFDNEYLSDGQGIDIWFEIENS